MLRLPTPLVLLATIACSATVGDGASGPAGPASTPTSTTGIAYPTASGGRTWSLPANAETAGPEWRPETGAITQIAEGVFETQGNGGEVRLNVPSPSGKAWWRNVEITGYFRAVRTVSTAGQVPHWELLARGERHSSTPVTGDAINEGVEAPAGTATWPGYPYGSVSVNPHCLGTTYHGNFYLTGQAALEKEISHTEGYASQRGIVTTHAPALGQWFGLKFVVRNVSVDTRVHLELWLDPNADGAWRQISSADDEGGWAALDPNIDGCGAAPFGYAADELLTWAGPWVTFRSDAMVLDFTALSVREIAPLP